MEIASKLALIAQAAGSVLMQMPRGDLNSNYKKPGELVTDADKASHAVIRRELELCFPDITLIMEEQENPAILPENFVVADELDGTAIYANGMEEWGISIAYIEKGRPVAGVIYQPAKDKMLTSELGKGTWLNDNQVIIDSDQAICDGIVALEINRFQSDEERSWACRLACNALAIRSLSTAVGNTIELLSGNTLLYLNARGAKIWDFATAVLAVEEAGGVAMGCSGEKLVWNQIPMGVLLAVNERIADTALNLKERDSKGLS